VAHGDLGATFGFGDADPADDAADLEALMRIQDGCYTSIVPESRGSLLAKLRVSPATCLVAIKESAPYWARYGFEEAPGPQADMLASYGNDARLST
jgi:hypothetical protein